MATVEEHNDEAWHTLPGASLRFRLRFVATLRLRLGAGSGLPSADLFCLFEYSDAEKMVYAVIGLPH